jgi:broad specificity phosphatase PhoE
VLVVTHDVPILLARYVLDGMTTDEVVGLSRQIVNCGLTTYRREGAGIRLEAFNDPTPVAEETTVTAHE